MELNRSNCWYDKVCSISGDDCIKHCIRYEEMVYLMDNSGIPKTKQKPVQLYPSDIDKPSFVKLKEIKDDIEQFVKDGKNLYICSNTTGNGKTSWAIKLMLKYFDSIWAGNGFRVRGMFVHVPTLLVKLKDFNNPLSKEYLDNLLNTDLVVWDDIASSGISSYDYNQLLIYIDQRTLNGKSNIYTSNSVTQGEVESMVGVKLFSRLFTHDTEVIEFKGGDRR